MCLSESSSKIYYSRKSCIYLLLQKVFLKFSDALMEGVSMQRCLGWPGLLRRARDPYQIDKVLPNDHAEEARMRCERTELHTSDKPSDLISLFFQYTLLSKF